MIQLQRETEQYFFEYCVRLEPFRFIMMCSTI